MPKLRRAVSALGTGLLLLSAGAAIAARPDESGSTTNSPQPAIVAAVEPPQPAVNAAASSAEPVPQLPLAPVPPAQLANGTLIEIRLTEGVNSRAVKVGDWFGIAVNQPVMLGEQIIVPEGTAGRGQIVHVAKSSWGGKAGELIVAARYLELNGAQIPLRGMKLGGVGRNNEGLAFATSIAGGLAATPIIFALNGKNADLPEGTLATAKLAIDLPLPATPELMPAAAPSEATAAPPAETRMNQPVQP